MTAPSPSLAWPDRLCGRPEFEPRLRQEAASAIEGLLSAMPRPLDAVFLAGSAAAGEAVVAPGPGGAICLSDLDIGLVLRSPADREPVRAAIDSWLEGERAARARAYFSGLDIGIYAPADLPAQALKPGTFEMAVAAFIVRGEKDALATLPRFEPAAMPAIEARRLLANRVSELLHAATGDPVPARAAARPLDAAYAAGKLLLDAGTALLVASGSYVAGLEERCQAILRSRAVAGAFGADAPVYLEAARFWTDIRRGRVEWRCVADRYRPAPGVIVAFPLWDAARTAVSKAWGWLDGSSGDGAWMAGTPARERARRWRGWARGRAPLEGLEALTRLSLAGPREIADESVVLLFEDWPAGEGEAPPSGPTEKALHRLLPSAARPDGAAGRVSWARALGAARGGLVRAGDE